MSKTMSKQELTKWKNKLRLWRIMHHEEVMDCKNCANFFKIPTRNCPWLKGELTLTVNYDGNKVRRVRMDTQENKESFWCCEWIKYVP